MGESLERLTAKQVEELRSGEGVADDEEGFDIEYLRPHPSLPDVYQIKWIGHEKMTCESRASLLIDLTEADVASLLARGPRTLWVERPEFPVGVRVNVRYPRAKSKTVSTVIVRGLVEGQLELTLNSRLRRFIRPLSRATMRTPRSRTP
jgi:hypothetical protein